MECEEGLVPRGGGGKRAGRWRRALRRRLPVLRWLPRYDRVSAVADLVAGVTLGLTLVPQSIAYASLANLPVQYGLYSSFIGTMMYVLLGTVKEVSIGPTSLMALFTLQVCRGLPVEFVVLLTFLSGCVVLAMGLLRLGFLVELISPSVTSGFTSATAVIIVAAQLKGLLGLSFTAETVVENIRCIVAKWDDIRYADAALGAVCCSVLLLLRKVKDIPVSEKRGRLRRALWLLSISRNALVVLAASSFAYLTHHPNQPLFKLSGRVEPGLPSLAPPPFSAAVDNSTVHFVDMVQQLGSAVLMLPVVMVLANIAIAKAFCTCAPPAPPGPRAPVPAGRSVTCVGCRCGRARGRHAGDGDAGAVQHGGVAGARHAHVRRLHALGRQPRQRRAHARRRPLLRYRLLPMPHPRGSLDLPPICHGIYACLGCRYNNSAGTDIPDAVLLLHS
ncbi:unnamed protein product [Chrysodeixis includens]|uniref:SLC26A/SulP transporter domain-containing protein n=1 Tax=Chrysodeixis includens TaxID=689277 RepID=A0A9P0BM19_CHRIL|nr:unnamed protein product [Chrysodeixis includens]